MSTALKREHHFVKKSPSSGADLRSRLLKWVHRCNGASSRAPKSTKKLKKTAMNLPIMLKFQKRAFRLRVSEKVPNGNFTRTTKSERLSWEFPKKQDNSNFFLIESRLCIAKNRVWAPAEILQKKKVAHVYHRLSNMQNQDKMKKSRSDRSAIPATQIGRVGSPPPSVQATFS